jgi:hypothetical protein
MNFPKEPLNEAHTHIYDYFGVTTLKLFGAVLQSNVNGGE